MLLRKRRNGAAGAQRRHCPVIGDAQAADSSPARYSSAFERNSCATGAYFYPSAEMARINMTRLRATAPPFRLTAVLVYKR